MAEVLKKELLLEGLNCSKCLEDIKNKLNLKDYNLIIDYKTMNISFTVNEGSEYDNLIKYINNVLNNHEHTIKIHEKSLEREEGKTLVIGKLSCSNCAAKIESKVRNISGVKKAEIDFVNSKLNIVAASKADLDRVLIETKKIVKSIEPGAHVHEEHNGSHDHHHHHGDAGIVKKTVTTLVLAAIPLLLAIFLNLDNFVELGLFLVSYLIVGRSVITKALRSISRGDFFDENTLMMIATIGAFFIGEYHEAIAVMAFYLVGEMFQDLAVDKSRKSISELMDIKSDYANVLEGEKIIKLASADVLVGSLVIVKPGEKIPLDGIVYEGEAHIDTSSITGESIPRFVKVGSEVLSGFINKDKVLVIKTTKLYSDSTVSKIIELVENASSRKAPTENFITKFARVYTPIVVLTAFILAVLPPIILKQEFSIWIYRALSFLVVSCPCALVISVPLGFYGGIGFASRNGVLVKGGNYLEAFKNSEEIIFDKTGTLTSGKFKIAKINTTAIDQAKLLEFAAYAEYYSIHPIAAAIKESYQKDIDIARIKKYQEFSGLGISAIIDDVNILIGNQSLMEDNKIDFIEAKQAGTILYIAIDNKFVGSIVIVDEIKAEAKGVISKLKNLGVNKITMITGDKESVASEVANELRIDEFYSEVLPHQKVEILENKVKNSNKKIVFVGDGINDAPVLAISDIGISMGEAGSDAAIEASDIVIMNDNLMKIVDARQIARKTSRVVWQNIAFALFVKISVLIFAALGFINMWIAVFADVGVSLIAILNATRILKMKKTG
ncbi:MAG: cadmium-translocating P-type ATPase [Bacilli bacterium]|nr:cadmium-translocating P-type ATPase [Bacilli bacterium]